MLLIPALIILPKFFGLDGIMAAGRFGITPDRAQNCHADSEGIELNFRVMSEAVATFRECATMPEGWSDEIQKDYKRCKESQ